MSKENKKAEKKVYRDGLGEIKNPAQTLFGKVLIWILAISMVVAIFAALIFSIIEQF